MLTIKKITTFELPKMVQIAYEGDEELLDKYHVEKFNLEEAVESTVFMVDLTSEQVPMRYFKVEKDDEPIGYIVTFQNNLYSFGINIKYRTKEVLIQFWEYIKDILGESFICMLYPNNSRAIEWLEKCGMEIVDGVEETAVTLLYNKR